MLRYTLRKIYLVVITFVMLTLIAFSLTYLMPGEPMVLLTGKSTLTAAQLADLQTRYAFDQSYYQQYLLFMEHVLTGNWGTSLVSQQPIWLEILRTFTASTQIWLSAAVIAVLLGLPIGTFAALKRDSVADNTIIGISIAGYSVPVFWWALLLILGLSLGYHLFPISGQLSLLYDVPPVTHVLLLDLLMLDEPERSAALLNTLWHMTLPTLAVTIFPLTVIIRATRSELIRVMEQNYIHAARAKGMTRTQILLRHAFPNITPTLLRRLALLASPLLTSTMVVEVIFSWPGIGRWLLTSLAEHDIPAIQGGLIALASFIMLLNISFDLLAAWFAPREENA